MKWILFLAAFPVSAVGGLVFSVARGALHELTAVGIFGIAALLLCTGAVIDAVQRGPRRPNP